MEKRKQRIVRSQDGRKFVITIDASAYELDASGSADCTAALQKAIDDCRDAGGGTVYLPAGRYALYGELYIRTSVMLHGAGGEGIPANGTVLCCFYGWGTEEGAQIHMEACSGLLEVFLYHPAQNMEAPVPYPPVVRQQGSDSITVERATFVNPWTAIQCGPDGNELHMIRKVRISPLFCGIFMDMTTDIGRMQELSISPVWYENFIRTESPVNARQRERFSQAARDFMYHQATGIYMARSDWEYGHDILVEGCRTGLLITSGQDIGPNAQLSFLKIRGCGVGIRLHCGNPYGIAITEGSIESGEREADAAIWCEETFTTVLQCLRLTVTGNYRHLICQEGSGQISLVECSLKGRGKEEDILQKAGGLSLVHSTFAAGGTHLRIRKGAGGAQVVGCRAVRARGESLPVIEVEEGAEDVLLLESRKINLSGIKCGTHPAYPYPLEPQTDQLYVVSDYGAVGNGRTDDTEAFRAALEAAGRTGGYVYVPGGSYRLTESLVVPQGVELRGTAEVPCHTMGGGSILMICCGEGQEEGEPFLSLEGGCGLRGLVLYHPRQDPMDPRPYPWAVRAGGNRCYVIDTVFVNAWKGIDFGSAGTKDHYISYVSGAPIRCGIWAGKNDGGMWVENVQYNPHYWYRCSLPGRPQGDTWISFWHNQIRYLDAFVYGANKALHVLNTFVFAARNGVLFEEQDHVGSHGTMIGHGTDGGECGIRIEGVQDMELINTELVVIESPNRRIYLRNAGEGAAFYNTLMWGAPDTAVLMESGSLKMFLTNIVDAGKPAVDVEDGELDLAVTHFYREFGSMSVKNGKIRFLSNMTDQPASGGRSIAFACGVCGNDQ